MSKYTRFIAILAALALVGLASSAMAATIRVAASGDDSDGTTWAKAYQTMGKAIAAANAAAGADVLWVKAGTYDVTDVDGTSTRVAMTITGDLSIYGGLDGDETTQDEVDAQAVATRSTVGHTQVIVNLAATTEASTATQGVFKVASGLTVLMDQVNITSGVALVSTTADCGYPGLSAVETLLAGRIAGGINTGTNCTLELANCTISKITCLGPGGNLFYGGPIQMRRGAMLKMTDCSVSTNTCAFAAGTNGGTSIVVEGLVDMNGCMFEGNNGGASPSVTTGRAKSNGTCLSIHAPCPGASTIENCTFRNNSGSFWGPLRLAYDTTGTAYSIKDCVFQNNTGNEAGAILMCTGYQPGSTAIVGWGKQRGKAVVDITGCTFTGNQALGSGGGAIREFEGSVLDEVTISDCTFKNNWSAVYGGAALFKEWNDIAFENCTFENNSAGGAGGASCVQCEGEATVPDTVANKLNYSFANCLFKANTGTSTGTQDNICVVDIGGSTSSGGGIIGRILNCTFVGNKLGSAATPGGTVATNRRAAGDYLLFINNTCAGNTGLRMVRAATTGMFGRIENNCTGGLSEIANANAAAPSWNIANNNTSATPGIDTSTGLINSAASAAIDAGIDSDSSATIPAFDKLGKGRVDVAGVGTTLTDMGAFEYTNSSLTFNPSSIAFTPLPREVDAGPTTATITVLNRSIAVTPVIFSEAIQTSTYSGEFAVELLSGTRTLAPGESAVLKVTWTPVRVDLTVPRSVNLLVTHTDNDVTNPFAIPLTGTPVPVELSVIRIE